jgi:hypothetical protein
MQPGCKQPGLTERQVLHDSVRALELYPEFVMRLRLFRSFALFARFPGGGSARLMGNWQANFGLIRAPAMVPLLPGIGIGRARTETIRAIKVAPSRSSNILGSVRLTQ